MDTALIITVIVLGISFIANILLGAIVLFRSPQKRLNQSFFALTLAASFWVLTNLLFVIITEPSQQLVVALLSYVAAASLALFFLFYCLGLVRVTLNRAVSAFVFVVGLIFTVSSVLPGYIATEVTDDSKIITNNIPLMLYGLYLLTYLGGGMATLLWARARARGIERAKITIVLFGLLVAAIVGLFFNLILPITGNYDFVDTGPVATLILAGSSTYAIIRHRLFDIKLAAVRTIAYAGVLLTISGVYYLLAYFVSIIIFNGQVTDTINNSPINITLALLLAFLFQPIKRFFDRVTNDVFYRDVYKSDEFFAELSQLLVSTTDLRGLLERASKDIASTFKAEQVFFFLYYKNAIDHHMSAGTPHHAKLPVHDARILDDYVLRENPTIILSDFLTHESGVRRMLISHKVTLVLPLRRGEEIIGYVCLGDSLSGQYTKRDIQVLSTIADELVIAIQNALSLHEIKELNATLQQRIDVATKELRSSNAQLKHLDEVKDEFMSMASHQLRTPLTSIKGYLSMVLDGDVGKVSPKQHKLLLEAFNSSERMVRLVADFLNVSRLQTGKFIIEKMPADIKSAIKQEIKDLELLANSHDIKLKLSMTDQPLPIVADESKIRQVVMNFVDNAIYYSPVKSTIVVKVERVKDWMTLTVTDMGIGVPESEQHKLFTKFFRAKNARKQRPDGTGVGLYLARRVITAHNGSLIFSSREGKGSTFGFRIPLDQSAELKK